ncbi:MAG: MBL fold metallo-hydrolase [Clostridia bacterium]|nr:MBL fold metallo-hydrolase [Clostridia bacterium]
MKLSYLGHASFLITCNDGLRIVTDPYPADIYPHEPVECDLVTMSHDHFDHCDLSLIEGTPKVIKELEPLDVRGLHLYGVKSFHDEVGGKKRGENTIFVFEADGERLAHLGDLGQLLSDEQVAAIGALDVLLIPVGGTFTLDPKAAVEVAKQLRPKRVIPMHYACKGHSFKLVPAAEFVRLLESETDIFCDKSYILA